MKYTTSTNTPKSIEKKLKKIIREYGDAVLAGKDTQASLSALYSALSAFLTTILKDCANLSYNVALPKKLFAIDGQMSKTRIEEVLNRVWCNDGKVWSERIWQSITDLQRELTYAIMTEQSPNYIKRAFNVEYSKAKRILNTEYSYISNAAAVQRYEDAGIEEYEIITKPGDDGRICNECKSINHKVIKIAETNPLPLHPNCRCAIVPIIKRTN